MAQVSGAQRLDPYKNFKLRLWEGTRLHAGNMFTGLVSSGEVANYRDGDDPSNSPRKVGRSKYDAITLQRGVTHSQSFSDWASSVWNYGSTLGGEVPLGGRRKHVLLEFYNEAGSLVVRYTIYKGGVSESPALPPAGTIRHGVHPARGSVEKQLAAIFESSLRRLMP